MAVPFLYAAGLGALLGALLPGAWVGAASLAAMAFAGWITWRGTRPRGHDPSAPLHLVGILLCGAFVVALWAGAILALLT